MENSSDAIKIAVGVIITLLVAVIAFGIYKSGKGSADSANTQLTEMNQTLSESQYTQYESSNLLGSQVQSALSTFNGDYIWVSYEAANGTVQSINYAAGTTTISGEPSDNTDIMQRINKKTEASYYINPNQSYTGMISRDAQGIVGIQFTKN